MPKSVPELFFDPLLPKLEPEKIGNLTIPRWGYITNAEARAEAAIAKSVSDDIETVVYIAEVVAMFLRSRLGVQWTPEAVLEQIPFNFVEAIYDLFSQEKKPVVEAIALEDLKKQNADLRVQLEKLTGTMSTGSSDTTFPTSPDLAAIASQLAA